MEVEEILTLTSGFGTGAVDTIRVKTVQSPRKLSVVMASTHIKQVKPRINAAFSDVETFRLVSSNRLFFMI